MRPDCFVALFHVTETPYPVRAAAQDTLEVSFHASTVFTLVLAGVAVALMAWAGHSDQKNRPRRTVVTPADLVALAAVAACCPPRPRSPSSHPPRRPKARPSDGSAS